MNDPDCLNEKTEKRSKHYWVYVIQSEQKRYGKNGKELPGHIDGENGKKQMMSSHCPIFLSL